MRNDAVRALKYAILKRLQLRVEHFEHFLQLFHLQSDRSVLFRILLLRIRLLILG